MPNSPYLDSSVHWRIKAGTIEQHEPAYGEVAQALLDCGLATRVGPKLGSGKEADVYLCLDGARAVAIKVYRFYRTTHRGGGPIKADQMGHRAAREFELLGYAYRGGAPVPTPFRRIEGMFSMEFLGSRTGPAPRLQQIDLEEPADFLSKTLDAIEALLDAGIVHSDLSPFNILVYEDRPWLIDLADGLRVDRLGESPWMQLQRARDALERGLRSLDRYFRAYGLDVHPKEVGLRWLKKIDQLGLFT